MARIKLKKAIFSGLSDAFHNERHSREIGQPEIEALLTQNQAFNAILFLYRDVLNQTLDFNI